MAGDNLSDVERLFLHRKTVDVLLNILEAEERGEDVYPLSISKSVGSPYSYVSKVLSELENNAIVESEYAGRTRIVRLTKDGRELAVKFRELRGELSKDFVSRKKLAIIEEFLKKYEEMKLDGKDIFFAYAPIKFELESLLSSLEGRDPEAFKRASELMDVVRKRLEG